MTYSLEAPRQSKAILGISSCRQPSPRSALGMYDVHDAQVGLQWVCIHWDAKAEAIYESPPKTDLAQ